MGRYKRSGSGLKNLQGFPFRCKCWVWLEESVFGKLGIEG